MGFPEVKNHDRIDRFQILSWTASSVLIESMRVYALKVLIN